MLKIKVIFTKTVTRNTRWLYVLGLFIIHAYSNSHTYRKALFLPCPMKYKGVAAASPR